MDQFHSSKSQEPSKKTPEEIQRIRQGIPLDLEDRLQKAWLQTQLYSGNSNGGRFENQETWHPARQIKKDLTQTLEGLWIKTQTIKPNKPPSQPQSLCSQSKEPSVTSENVVSNPSPPSTVYTDFGTQVTEVGVETGVEAEDVVTRDLWLEKVEAVEPVSLTDQFLDDDFFRGLEGLEEAFNELEELLPVNSLLPEDDDDIFQFLNADPEASTVEQETQQKEERTSGKKRGSDDTEDISQPLKNPKVNLTELLMSIAHGITTGNIDAIQPKLRQLSATASVYGSANQRLSAYFLEGLVARIAGSKELHLRGTQINVETTPAAQSPFCDRNLVQAFETLISSSPYLTFGNVACNSAILDAFQGHDHVHVVDFGLGFGIQWPSLIQALSVRPGGPPKLHITGVDLWAPDGVFRTHCVIAAGKRLEAVAAKWNVPFQYDAIRSRLEDVKPHQINTFPGEVLAVNCSLRLHNILDETATPSNPRSAVLRTIRALNPAILTIVEQNTNQNSPFFLSRFYEAVHYYSALFDLMESSLPEDSEERRVFEHQVLGKAIVNVVACEGKDRVQRQETLGIWQRRVKKAGFEPLTLSPSVVSTVQSLLDTYSAGYDLLREDVGSLILTWKEKPLLAMSAWKCNRNFRPETSLGY